MYAIVGIKGFQYKLKEGDTLKVPKFDLVVGEKFTVSDVLLISEDKKVTIGTPFVEGAIVEATVVNQGDYKKILVFKKKRRKDYFVKNGHRQGYTEIEIGEIKTSPDKTVSELSEEKEVKASVSNE